MKTIVPVILLGNNTHRWDLRTDCIWGNGQNFTLIENTTVNPCGMLVSQATTTVIDYTRVKYISFNNNLDTTFQYSANTDPRIAYVADKGNHCIRLLNVDQSFVSTVAGICGSASLPG